MTARTDGQSTWIAQTRLVTWVARLTIATNVQTDIIWVLGGLGTASESAVVNENAVLSQTLG